MSVAERSYMGPTGPSNNILPPECAGIIASSEADAEKLLKWACPTQGWDGKYYRVTIAISNIPVSELYNVLSNLNFIAQNLADVADPVVKKQVEFLKHIHELIKSRDEGLVGAIVFDGQNIHAPRLEVPIFAPRYEGEPPRLKKKYDDLFDEVE